MAASKYCCNICTRKVLSHANQLKCSACDCYVHLRCLHQVNEMDDLHVHKDFNIWFCTECSQSMFPFNHFMDDKDFLIALEENLCTEPSIPFEFLSNNDKIFTPFDFNDESSSPLTEVDPDIQFYNDQCNQRLSSCDYMLEDAFNDRISNLNVANNGFSIMHTNIRSIPKNLSKLRNYLSNLAYEFSVIALSESWIKEHSVERYEIEGYRSVHNFRNRRGGGGVALYVKDTLEFRLRNDLSIQNSYIESLFIEIDNNIESKSKKTICGVIYRPPDTDLKVFNEHLSNILACIKSENKMAYISGDFNANLLNIDNHSATNEFLDLLFSHSFIPNITKPTRVTPKSATLIDNIFSNSLSNDNKILNGILYTDISDHFPIFHIDYSTKIDICPRYITKRTFSDKGFQNFTDAIHNEKWGDVISIEDPQFAYSLFHNKFSKIYEDCFPYKTVKVGYKNRKPWLTDSLKKCIKRKNNLYKRKKLY